MKTFEHCIKQGLLNEKGLKHFYRQRRKFQRQCFKAYVFVSNIQVSITHNGCKQGSVRSHILRAELDTDFRKQSLLQADRQ